MSQRYVNERKWRVFGEEVSKHFQNKVSSIFVTLPQIKIPKHFSDRIQDRSTKYDSKIIETMFYHLINYNLCEFLYWYKSNIKSLDVIIGDYRITFDRDKNNNIIARTFWYGLQTKTEKPHLMKIFLEKKKG